MGTLWVLSVLLAAHTVTALPCRSYYTSQVDTQFTPGVTLTVALTVSACRTQCEADVACLGFDHVAATSECSFITSNTATSATLAGVNHYTKTQACDSSEAPERCFFSYLGENSHAAAVGPVVVKDTLEKCLDLCVQFQPSCTAVFFNSTGSECFVLLATLATSDLVPNPDFRAYETTSCNPVPLDGTCEDSYEERVNYLKEGGNVATNNRSQIACETTCNTTEACLSYDFETPDNFCFLHEDVRTAERSELTRSITHYRKAKTCQTNETCTYRYFGAYVPVNTFARTMKAGIISLSECLVACGELGAACTGLAYNAEFNDCYLYESATSSTAFSDQSTFVPGAGEVSYMRVGCSTSTTIVPTTAPGVCATRYRAFPGKKLGNAQGNGIRSLTECQNQCTVASIDPCWGIDYNTQGSSCWWFLLSNTQVTPYQTPTDSQVPNEETHYEKYLQCGECEFDVYETQRSTSLEQTTSHTDVNACLTACNAQTTCTGADFVSGTCYFLTAAPTASTRLTDTNSVQYVKKNCVGTPGTLGCNYNNFKLYEAKKISGGVLVTTSPLTNASCQAYCNSLFSCYSFDTNGTGHCFPLTQYGEIRDVQTAGENHFHREPVCDFTAASGCNFFGTGTSKPAGTSTVLSTLGSMMRDACLEACATTAGGACSGVTYDSASQVCTLFNAAAGKWEFGTTDVSTSATSEGYVFNGCPGTGSTTVAPPGTTLLTGTTVPPTDACVGGTWQVINDTNVNGGLPQGSLDNTNCRLNCINTANCVAIDHGFNLCFFHLDLDAVMNVNNRLPFTGNYLQILTRCADITTPTPGGVCVPEYVKSADMKVVGGTEIPNLNTIAACEQHCDQDATCTGFDFQRTATTCYKQTSTSSPVPVQNNEPVDNYRRSWDCSGCDYINIPDRRGLSGVAMSQYTTLTTCINACAAHSTCTSISFNPSTSACEFHTTASLVIGQLTVATGYQFWFSNSTKPCSGATTDSGSTTSGGTTQPPTPGCVDGYAPILNQHIIGGAEQTSISDVGACKAACDADATCVALDFNNASNGCWLLTVTAPLSPETGTIHYRKTTICGACTVTTAYDVLNSSKVLGGARDTTVNTLDGCTSACDARSDCRGFDFTPTNACFVIDSSNQNSVQGSGNEQVTHRTKYIKCGDTCRYDIRLGSAVSGTSGAVQSGVVTWKDCVSSCTSQGATCQSVNFNTATNQCQHFAATYENTGRVPNANVNHYFKNACDGQDSTTPGGTDSTTTSATTVSCPASYTAYPGEKVVSLIRESGATTQPACETACNALSTCIGYDYNSLGDPTFRCYLQQDGTKTRSPQRPGESVTHYELRRSCSGCAFTASGGVGLLTYNVMTDNTEERCVAACAQSASCQAAAFIQQQCRHSTTTTTTPTANVKTWLKTGTCTGVVTPQTTLPPDASCTEAYISYPNQHVSGGTFTGGASTDAACRALCGANCVGYDYGSTGCFLITDAVAQKNDIVPDTTGTTHYSKVMNCNGVCYRQIQNAGVGSFSNFGSLSRVNCLLECNNQATCRDVMYNPNQPTDTCRHVIGTQTLPTLPTLSGTTYYSRLQTCATNAPRAP